MKAEKLVYLEAVRGIAALIVVFSHFIYAFYPDIKGTTYAGAATTSFAGLVAMTPLGIWHEGRFAVRIFFVLSGLVLSLSFFQTGDREKAVSGAIRRYFRLVIPIFAAVLLGYVLQRYDLFFNEQVAAKISNAWLAPFYQFDASLTLLFREAFYGAFLSFNPHHTYDSVLWTMEVEFLGSIFVFAFLLVFGNWHRRWCAYTATFAILLLTGRLYTIDFLLGLILCDLFTSRRDAFRFPLWLGTLLVGTGLFLGGLRQEWLALPGAPFWDSIGATFVIAGIIGNSRLQDLLQIRCFAFLGRISFTLYLVHWLVLMSLGCGLYLPMRDAGLTHLTSALAAGSAYVAASLVMAWLLYHCSDRPAVWLGHTVYRHLRRITAEIGERFRPPVRSPPSPAA